MLSALIVDDERLDREGLKSQIDWRAFGIDDVREAKNAREALAMMDRQACDILLTDISMPGMNGLELAGETRARSPDTRVLLISGYDHFEYAQRAIALGVCAYILKPVETEALENALTRALKEIRARSSSESDMRDLRSRVTSSAFWADSERVSAFLLRAGRAGDERIRRMFEGRSVTLAVLEADEEEQALGEMSTEECERSTDAMRECIWEYASARGAVAARIYPTRYALFFFENEGGPEWEDSLRALVGRVRERGGLQATALVAEPQTDYRNLPDTYLECCRLMMKKVFVGGEPVLWQRRSAISPNLSDEQFYASVSEEVRQCVRNFDAGRLQDFLHTLYAEMRDGRRYSFAYVRGMTMSLTGVLRNALADTGISCKAISDPLLYERVMRCDTYESLMQAARDCGEAVAQTLREGGEQHARQVCALLVQYVEEHYGESITLKSIAPCFYYSPNHLGVLFRRAKGISFYEYLTRYRMRVAARLLEDPSLYIYEIARRVSFKNTNSFSAQFRRVYGVNPTEYAQRARGEIQP